MTIKTLHGRITFKVQRFKNGTQPTEKEQNYFDLTGQFQDIYITPRLQELSAYYSTILSYKEVENLVIRVTGDQQISDQKAWQIVNDKAVEISQSWQDEVEKTLNNKELSFPKIQDKIDIYDSESREVVVLEDAIQVRGQKENRLHKQKVNEGKPVQLVEKPLQWAEKEKSSPVFTNIAMLQKKNQEFEFIVAPVDEKGQETVSLPDMLRSRVIQEYGSESEPVPIIAITDGAQVIRQHLFSVFGVMLIVILDWYHLGKKVRDLMSMIARNKDEKNLHLKFIFYHLWRGEVYTVMDYLEKEVQPKNEEKHRELINYLNKHRDEIIDYRRRKKAGKIIGSGYMEKGCDQVVGHRQKKKGMSWREAGSRSLGILRVTELNHQWKRYRFYFTEAGSVDSSF
ncbi:MAG: hypothetical protein MZV65_38390 [Chromatiales bacterium]|nr:hypothetical protein [Chromatiales bacterium]